MLVPNRHGSSADYRYGFQGQEKDDEVKGEGNYISFGDYGLDVRTGRRFNLDPHMYKYPMLSPYSTFNNNPIIYNDTDGRDWGISTKIDKNGNEIVTVKLTAAVLNASANKKLNMGDFASALKDQVQTSYSIKYTKVIYIPKVLKRDLDGRPSLTIKVPKEVTVTVNVQVDVRVINKESQLKGNEHLIRIDDSDKLSGAYGKVNKIGGKVVDIGETFVPNMINGLDNNTLVHELGHSLGLRHIDKKAETFWEKVLSDNPQYMNPKKQRGNSTNAMFSGTSPYMNDEKSTKITGEQIEIARNAAKSGDINKD